MRQWIQRTLPMVADSSDGLPPLIASLLRPEAYPHPVEAVQLVETHISWVLLTGHWAYKIKKPIDLGFVQAGCLSQRQHFCREELRLNRRLAPDLYCAVVSVLGPAERARISLVEAADGLIEPAVRMRQFPARSLLSRCLADGVPRSSFAQLAEDLARFHRRAEAAPVGGRFGNVEAVVEPVETNLRVLEEEVSSATSRHLLARHRAWLASEASRLGPRFRERLRDGAIRECHGDLHCGNVHRRDDGSLEVFDAIDFNPGLRWIDPISEMAFLAMDLQVLGEPAAAACLLNRWLECSGDYAGMDLWRWYSAYRAMVRAKVTALRQRQAPNPANQDEMERYLARAAAMESAPGGGLVLMHGLSGSGKSFCSEQLVASLPALRLRSDLERARAFGRLPGQESWRHDADPYSPEVNAWLFGQHLPALTQRLLSSGFHVIVDATFLRQRERQQMLSLASRLQRPAWIVACHCSDATAAQRLIRRQQQGRDPSEADLAIRQRQQRWLEPLVGSERSRCLPFDEGDDPEALAVQLRQRLRADAASLRNKG